MATGLMAAAAASKAQLSELLGEALWQGDFSAAQALLTQGAHPNAPDAQHKNTPLHYAATGNNLKCVRLMLDAGADPTVSNKDGETPLHIAARFAKPDCALEILQKDPATALLIDLEGNTALASAARIGSEAGVRALAKHIDPNLRNHMGRDALMIAAASGNMKTLPALMGLCDLSAKDGLGLGATQIAEQAKMRKASAMLADATQAWEEARELKASLPRPASGSKPGF